MVGWWPGRQSGDSAGGVSMSIVNCTGGRQLLDDIKPFPLLPHTREDMCFLLHHRAKPDPFKNLKVEENYQAQVWVIWENFKNDIDLKYAILCGGKMQKCGRLFDKALSLRLHLWANLTCWAEDDAVKCPTYPAVLTVIALGDGLIKREWEVGGRGCCYVRDALL